ncbi:MAG: tryptophan--tRNA ligase [Eubacteriales bacterium]|nr:tryptophan--tRNA ligase [Eubacteriales bacterium]
MGKIILTGDRPTGKLHLGHYVGSVKMRKVLQEDKTYSEIYILLADLQALTDNATNPDKIRKNIIECALDYLACGLDPNRLSICVQSSLPALYELYMYYLNLVSTKRLERNPTVKSEMQMRGFDQEGLPVGFYTYPISQAADITAFCATTVPVGEDQDPMIEQAREIVEKFNNIYGNVLTLPETMHPSSEISKRLPGLDGKSKMSKSLGNAIYLSDESEVLKEKIMKRMFTDPTHLQINDPGKIDGNMVFTYLDIFATDKDFKELLPEYNNLNEMKEHYKRGGLGDVKCKNFLYNILNNFLTPIREKRHYWESHISDIYDIIQDGTKKALIKTNNTLDKVKEAMKIDYFNDKSKITKEWEEWLASNRMD